MKKLEDYQKNETKKKKITNYLRKFNDIYTTLGNTVVGKNEDDKHYEIEMLKLELKEEDLFLYNVLFPLDEK